MPYWISDLYRLVAKHYFEVDQLVIWTTERGIYTALNDTNLLGDDVMEIQNYIDKLSNE